MPSCRRTQSVQLFAFFALVMFLNAALVPTIAGAAAEEQRASDLGVYSPGGWSTLHRGPANRKLVQDVKLAASYSSWTALEGASILTAPTMSPDGKTMYVATGQAEGKANLHAFDLDGNRLWQAPHWTSRRDGVDPCAVLSSVIVDREGDLYLGDCNQLFAYHGDGRLKWVAPLPNIQEGDWIVSDALPVNALTTAVFTKDGDIFGVTNFGDIVVFDRKTGRKLNSPTRLPGHVPGTSAVMPMPPTIFGEGLLDEQIRDWAWQLLVGGAMPSANTPGVDMKTGRIFVAATAVTVGRGALYGIDLDRKEDEDGSVSVEVEIAFGTEMGPGSGSSPSLSPSGHQVYVSDENGRFYGVDARTGEVVWEAQTRAASAAAAVGADGTVYALQAYGPALIAIAEDGQVRWESDLEALAEAALPKSLMLGEPSAIGNGNPTVVDDQILVPIVYGFETRMFGRRIPWPVTSSLVAVDAKTGKGVRNVLSLADDSTGITVVLPDGSIVNSLGTAMTSGATPLAGLARLLLPGDLEPLLPLGGFQVSRPVSLEAASMRDAMSARLALRSDAHRRDDATRHPLEVLEFAGIREGMRVAELMAGGGWYAEVLARAVGPKGRVLAQNNEVSASRYGKDLARRLEAQGLEAIESRVEELDALGLESESFDAVFLVKFYHDTVWMGVDRPEMLRRIRDSLTPDGVFLVVDHAAEAGVGLTEVSGLHRIEEATLIAEVEAAGFRLAARSSLLANSGDDRTSNVFRSRVRGNTDRFLLRFDPAK